MVDLGRVGPWSRRGWRSAMARCLHPCGAGDGVAGLSTPEGMASEARVALYAGAPRPRRPRRWPHDDTHDRGALRRGQRSQAPRVPWCRRLEGLHEGAGLALPCAQRATSGDDGSIVLLPEGCRGGVCRGWAQTGSGAWRGGRAHSSVGSHNRFSFATRVDRPTDKAL